MDVFSKEKRSKIMSAVRSNNTGLEKSFFEWLMEATEGRAIIHPKNIVGSPDAILEVPRIAFFLDSCFWHGCKLHYRAPKSNRGYWSLKIKRNRDRDRRVKICLKKEGWRVVRIWEHSWKKPGTARWWQTRVINFISLTVLSP